MYKTCPGQLTISNKVDLWGIWIQPLLRAARQSCPMPQDYTCVWSNVHCCTPPRSKNLRTEDTGNFSKIISQMLMGHKSDVNVLKDELERMKRWSQWELGYHRAANNWDINFLKTKYNSGRKDASFSTLVLNASSKEWTPLCALLYFNHQ
jgi:hypothetical protein